MSDTERKTLFPPLPPVSPEAYLERLEDVYVPPVKAMTDLDAIRERHQRAATVDPLCAFDGMGWPCDAARAIARVDELEGQLAPLGEPSPGEPVLLTNLGTKAQAYQRGLDQGKARVAELEAALARLRGFVQFVHPDSLAVFDDTERKQPLIDAALARAERVMWGDFRPEPKPPEPPPADPQLIGDTFGRKPRPEPKP